MKGRIAFLTIAASGLLSSLVSTQAVAVPVNAAFTNTPECDNPPLTADHELGIADGAGPADDFPVDERIRAVVSTTTLVPCSRPPLAGNARPDDAIANSWEVRITNLSSIEYQDLWFVADGDNLIGNRDGTINGSDAFRIDNAGNNRPLRNQSRPANPNFDPNDTWTFIVQDYNWSIGALSPVFGSQGIAGASAGVAQSTASIIARRVPEPATLSLALVAFATAGFLYRRRG